MVLWLMFPSVSFMFKRLILDLRSSSSSGGATSMEATLAEMVGGVVSASVASFL